MRLDVTKPSTKAQLQTEIQRLQERCSSLQDRIDEHDKLDSLDLDPHTARYLLEMLKAKRDECDLPWHFEGLDTLIDLVERHA